MVKIAFEAQLFIKGNRTGIARCADNLIKSLSYTDEYKCQLNYFSGGCSRDNLKNLEEYRGYDVDFRECRWFRAVWYKLLWPFFKIPYWWFFGSDSQITQFFNYIIPPGVKGKKATMIHDMTHLAYPETVRTKTKSWLNLTLKQSCMRADVIITISNFSKAEIIRYMNIPGDKIKVMYPGVDLNVFHNHYPKEQIYDTMFKYGIKENYILYLGTIEPRKNLKRLIEAYGLLVEQRQGDVPQLVLAGGKGWLCENIYQAAEKISLQDKILFTGYVEEVDSPILLSGAKFFCFPSLYEGFGIPPIEALACGTPVMAANVASMPEVLGSCAVYVDPLSIEDIASGMKQLLTDEELRQRLRSEGLEHVKQYAWSNSAKTLMRIYKEILGGGE